MGSQPVYLFDGTFAHSLVVPRAYFLLFQDTSRAIRPVCRGFTSILSLRHPVDILVA
jgi:hypothetical protein